jgi:hypothetical protein
MKKLLFTRESNNFDDILKDPAVKRKFDYKISWQNNLLLCFEDSKNQDQTINYLLLKYGDDIKNLDIPDRSPVMHKDYVPVNKKTLH